jgi:Rad3-related DNA helicase
MNSFRRHDQTNTRTHHEMADQSTLAYGKETSTPDHIETLLVLVPSDNNNHGTEDRDEEDDINVIDQLAGFDDMAKRAQAILWSWENKFAEMMAANKKHEENLLEGMAIILNERDEKIEELTTGDSDRNNAQSQVIKTLERKIRQMHRALLDQKNLIANLQTEVERRNRVIDQLELENENLEREVDWRKGLAK